MSILEDNELRAEIDRLVGERDEARAEVERLKSEETRTTCAYCEAVHERPCTFDNIRAHIEVCPKHPMAALKARLTKSEAAAENLRRVLLLVKKEVRSIVWDDLFDSELVQCGQRALSLLEEDK